jgi:hypothetical protein
MTYNRYKQAENYVAMAMEVAVERATGRVMVRRVACERPVRVFVRRVRVPAGERSGIQISANRIE